MIPPLPGAPFLASFTSWGMCAWVSVSGCACPRHGATWPHELPRGAPPDAFAVRVQAVWTIREGGRLKAGEGKVEREDRSISTPACEFRACDFGPWPNLAAF